MEKLSEFGVLFLLFEMGLELSLDRLKVVTGGTDGQAGRQIEGCMDGWTDVHSGGRAGRWMDGWKGEKGGGGKPLLLCAPSARPCSCARWWGSSWLARWCGTSVSGGGVRLAT